jgi:hypothetical protein
MNAGSCDPFGRHGTAIAYSRFVALTTALITGSVWPAFARSDRPALDSHHVESQMGGEGSGWASSSPPQR